MYLCEQHIERRIHLGVVNWCHCRITTKQLYFVRPFTEFVVIIGVIFVVRTQLKTGTNADGHIVEYHDVTPANSRRFLPAIVRFPSVANPWRICCTHARAGISLLVLRVSSPSNSFNNSARCNVIGRYKQPTWYRDFVRVYTIRYLNVLVNYIVIVKSRLLQNDLIDWRNYRQPRNWKRNYCLILLVNCWTTSL